MPFTIFALALLAGLLGLEHAADAAPNSRSAQTSRWWRVTCPDQPAPCVFAVRLRGVIDQSRLRLFQEALRRRDATQRSLGRVAVLQADLDSSGGQVFPALEIGRLLRREGAVVRVGPGASCISACVFVLMGGIEREVAVDARIGLHSPSLGDARSDTLVPAMSEQLMQYTEEMGVSRRIVEDMLAIPASRMRYVTATDLARYGLTVSTIGR